MSGLPTCARRETRWMRNSTVPSSSHFQTAKSIWPRSRCPASVPQLQPQMRTARPTTARVSSVIVPTRHPRKKRSGPKRACSGMLRFASRLAGSKTAHDRGVGEGVVAHELLGALKAAVENRFAWRLGGQRLTVVVDVPARSAGARVQPGRSQRPLGELRQRALRARRRGQLLIEHRRAAQGRRASS